MYLEYIVKGKLDMIIKNTVMFINVKLLFDEKGC